MNLTRTQAFVSWPLQVLAAAILLQTLFFKFSGAEESVAIFTSLGAEPWGRIGTGVAELVTALLLLLPATAAVGALLGVGLMAGAVMSHMTILGIVVMDDGGLLFALALIVMIACAVVLVIRRESLPVVGSRLAPARGGGDAASARQGDPARV